MSYERMKLPRPWVEKSAPKMLSPHYTLPFEANAKLFSGPVDCRKLQNWLDYLFGHGGRFESPLKSLRCRLCKLAPKPENLWIVREEFQGSVAVIDSGFVVPLLVMQFGPFAIGPRGGVAGNRGVERFECLIRLTLRKVLLCIQEKLYRRRRLWLIVAATPGNCCHRRRQQPRCQISRSTPLGTARH
jgi:hypothetical protein